MLAAIFLISLYQDVAQTAPVDNSAAVPQATNENQQNRATWSIVWSCMLAVVACSWTAVHPNLPDPDDGLLNILWTRIKLVLLTLIAPEYVLYWALEQRRAAKELVATARNSRVKSFEDWTLSHGFLVAMGGFVLEDSKGNPLHPVVPGHDDMEFEHFEFPKVTMKEIQDRSKGDALLKLIVAAQVVWFLTQCIARGAQQLAVTELELVTVAYVVLTVFIYIVWWHKPLGATCYIPVTLSEGSKQARFSFWGPPNWRRKIEEVFLSSIPLQRRPRVPLLFSGNNGDNDDGSMLGVAYAVVVVFGAIHCAAWNFGFPTAVEQLLWRISSVAATGYPLIGLLVYLLTQWIDWFLVDVLHFLVACVGPPIYIAARLLLVVLPFIALRNLPPEATRSIEWTTMLPHVG